MSPINSKQANSEEWISISDLMAGLMFLFLLIAVWFMNQVQEESRITKRFLTEYVTMREEIVRDLTLEFQDEVVPWNIKIDSLNLAIRFQQPEVLFEAGEADLRPEFEVILSDFFPRYVDRLQPYEEDIYELRIEGHTSSDWKDKSGFEAYKENMRLSQDRTRSVLTFVAELPPVRQMWDGWLKERLTANGLSSSRPILVGVAPPLSEVGSEDVNQSRRVEFRVEIDAAALLQAIIDEMNMQAVALGAVS